MEQPAFGKGLTIEPATTKDARGRVLQEGDEILLNTRGPIYYRISKIEPVPLSQLQPGQDPAQLRRMLYVHVGVMLTFTAVRGQINGEFVRVRTAEEAGPSPFQLLDVVDTQQPGGGS